DRNSHSLTWPTSAPRPCPVARGLPPSRRPRRMARPPTPPPPPVPDDARCPRLRAEPPQPAELQRAHRLEDSQRPQPADPADARQARRAPLGRGADRVARHHPADRRLGPCRRHPLGLAAQPLRPQGQPRLRLQHPRFRQEDCLPRPHPRHGAVLACRELRRAHRRMGLPQHPPAPAGRGVPPRPGRRPAGGLQALSLRRPPVPAAGPSEPLHGAEKRPVLRPGDARPAAPRPLAPRRLPGLSGPAAGSGQALRPRHAPRRRVRRGPHRLLPDRRRAPLRRDDPLLRRVFRPSRLHRGGFRARQDLGRGSAEPARHPV
ncbi:MAG: hypothetical protein AVDCRST_MAG27-3791, partial [uncultured Craurococcus sp.]